MLRDISIMIDQVGNTSYISNNDYISIDILPAHYDSSLGTPLDTPPNTPLTNYDTAFEIPKNYYSLHEFIKFITMIDMSNEIYVWIGALMIFSIVELNSILWISLDGAKLWKIKITLQIIFDIMKMFGNFLSNTNLAKKLDSLKYDQDLIAEEQRRMNSKIDNIKYEQRRMGEEQRRMGEEQRRMGEDINELKNMLKDLNEYLIPQQNGTLRMKPNVPQSINLQQIDSSSIILNVPEQIGSLIINADTYPLDENFSNPNGIRFRSSSPQPKLVYRKDTKKDQ